MSKNLGISIGELKEKAKSKMNEWAVDFVNEFEDIEKSSDYLSDNIAEYANDKCFEMSKYLPNLLEWAAYNDDVIERCVKDYGMPEPFNLVSLCQQAYAFDIENEISECADEVAIWLIADKIQRDFDLESGFTLKKAEQEAIENFATKSHINLTADDIDSFINDMNFTKDNFTKRRKQ